MRKRRALQALIGLMGLMSLSPTAHAATDIVEYTCTPKDGTPQTVQIKVELTMPATAHPDEQFSITHRATYADSTAIQATAALPATAKMYAYVSISGFPSNLTSGTGVGDVVGPVTAGNTVTLPANTTAVRSTPRTAGTGTVRPGDITFGTTPNDRLIDCEPQNSDALTTYELIVTESGTDETPTPTPEPTTTTTETVTAEPEEDETIVDDETDMETPDGGVATGGGGSAGPDGRAVVLIGVTVLAAALTGLSLRRRV
ncbi:hypothetical protein [Herbidospora mongoliensis]|uniref:hypothetical protein n=1 Tax=Herbidospora mongoliensis TaxID=688067 RepID=UPI000A4FA743|nr:hypothetical protein [Herbidospora mongoliensis]